MNEEKIEQVVTKMLKDRERISSVEAPTDFEIGGFEYYFTYPGTKYQWSIAQDPKENYYLFFYPSREARSTFLRFTSDQVGFMGQEKLKDLFKLIQDKAYGFDDVLKDILED